MARPKSRRGPRMVDLYTTPEEWVTIRALADIEQKSTGQMLREMAVEAAKAKGL